MKDVLNSIKKYLEVTESERFIIHWKKLAQRLLAGIKNGYKKGDREPEIVNLIENIINRIDKFETFDREFKISTNSVFIHGNKSQVEFEYYGEKTERELGDIIFILSVEYNNKKYFEKMTINQVKKAKTVSWNFNKKDKNGKHPNMEQLYLLSRFPTFKGTKNSLIPMKEYNLPNYSGCLGSHGLLYYPGDFALISSKSLEVILLYKKQLKFRDLLLSIKDNYPFFYCLCNYLSDDLYLKECLYLLHSPRDFRWYPFLCCNLPVLGNNCIAYNSYDFSDKYLRGLIGELIYAKDLGYNHHAFQFLMDLLESIERKGGKYKNFVQDFKKFNYNPIGYGEDKNDKKYYEFDRDGGGLGIIYTIINLGKGE